MSHCSEFGSDLTIRQSEGSRDSTMVDKRFQITGARFSVALLIVAGVSGCQSIRKPTVFSRLGPATAEKVRFEQPHRMAVIWKETAMPTVPGKKSTRGFGGRVYFYNAADEPVRVAGDFIVYAFDDSVSESIENGTPTRTPDRKYVYRASELQQHFSQSGIGPSYSIWVPWDEVGGKQVSVALLPMFKPIDGQIVNAGQSIAVLPGKDTEIIGVEVNNASLNTVRQASAELPDHSDHSTDVIGSREENARRRRTTTIELPRGLSRQMQQLPAQPLLSGIPAPGARTHIPPPTTAVNKTTDMTESDQRLFQRVTDESTRGTESGKFERQPVFGSPGPFR